MKQPTRWMSVLSCFVTPPRAPWQMHKDLRKVWQKVARTPSAKSKAGWSGHFVMVAAYLRWKASKSQDAVDGQVRLGQLWKWLWICLSRWAFVGSK